ncbi:PLP-dependent aminotransferase family protein [Streptomyces palmae]|uniref:PLP-dependent aminotransferase family protein n=1 Tax=Streptomyces palmae TaxID=1701085 RepID=A0A4Z0HA56_9ACTN|nr:PLP-dependent aminotransferase family protein [Streptomyces palmae]TGB06050.1 PLP-dependent aminotransferase family protein [Streptomyces palmae]
MAETWATGRGSTRAAEPGPDAEARFGSDLHLDLTGAGTTGGVRATLIRALRDAVRGGRLAPGTRLPSSRTLAADLGIARNTVADAYGELVAEGWLTARQGSGTRVARRAIPPEPAGPRVMRPALAATRPRYDATPGKPDVSAFPRADWLAAARRALTAAPSDAFGYGDPRGRPELRGVLADYLARARGVRAHPERIVVCTGFMQALALLGRVLRARGGRGAVAVESYGLDIHREVFTRGGLRTVPLTVDEHGARTGRLEDMPGVGAVLLTPAHQFPTGVPMHSERRAAVVDWANRTGGLVLEDDYDGEFRYDRQPVGALQGLDPEHVVYLGTASKSLAPALRLAWMVLPERMVDEVLEQRTGEWGTGTLEQLTLAEFIAGGGYDRHVRGMRVRYRRRRDQLVAALAEKAPHIRVTGIAAGLHAVLQLPAGTERSVVQGAAWQGLALQGLSAFRHPDAAGPGLDTVQDALVFAYGTPPDHSFSGALDALLRALP